MQAPFRQALSGARVHFSHGPIDLVIGAEGEGQAAALNAGWERFQRILPELVAELSLLRQPVGRELNSPVARRMRAACLPFAEAHFITPMAAVAGAVADEIKGHMLEAGRLDRLYVNNGGDIALFLHGEARFAIGMAGDISEGVPARGQISIGAGDGIGGVATSGWRGRSFSLGIADAVTVLARTAAEADAAATIIANAVNCENPAISRQPADTLDADSDLGARLVTVAVGPLDDISISAALGSGAAIARQLCASGLIKGAMLALQGRMLLVNTEAKLEDGA